MLRLVGVGVGVEEFQWSEDEQVWPFEKANDGSTLYCKEVDCGAGPNNGYSYTNHGIANIGENYFNSYAYGRDPALNDAVPLPHNLAMFSHWVSGANVVVWSTINYSHVSPVIARIFYTKNN